MQHAAVPTGLLGLGTPPLPAVHHPPDLTGPPPPPRAVQVALGMVSSSGGIDMARALARSEGDAALRCLEGLPDCPSKRSLQMMVDYVLDRLY